MRYYMALISVILLFTWKEYSTRKQEYDDAHRLNKDFEKWVMTKGESKRPNNALFVALFKKCYKQDTLPQALWKRERGMLYQKQFDVLVSFPSIDTDALSSQYGILDNLEDYYELKFNELRTIKGVVNYVISLPLILLKYIGIDADKTYSKLLHVFIWATTLFRQQIYDFLVKLIQSIFNLK